MSPDSEKCRHNEPKRVLDISGETADEGSAFLSNDFPCYSNGIVAYCPFGFQMPDAILSTRSGAPGLPDPWDCNPHPFPATQAASGLGNADTNEVLKIQQVAWTIGYASI